MYWTKDHDLLLIREVLAVDPYSQPKGSRERAKLWEEIAMSLNSVSAPQFSVTVRSVRDRVNLVLIKKHKKKVAEENKASGIAPDEPSEFELGMDEICEKAEAAERDQQVISDERKANLEKEKKQAEDMRAQALEKVGETKKRMSVGDNGSGEPEKKEKRARRSGTETIAYLKEKSAKEFQIRQEELQIRKEEQCAQAKRQEQMTQQLIQQQEHQQNMFANLQQQQNQRQVQMTQQLLQQQEHQQDMFANLQQQQNQQLQQLNQMQMAMMQQQQQQSQALIAVLQEFAKKKTEAPE